MEVLDLSVLNVGVIGVGAIGRTHINRLTSSVNGARVTAVSDVQEDAARKIAGEYGATFYAKGEDLIASPEVDAVVVCSWDPTHEKYVLAAIAAGKFVFCEKPLAETAVGCREIVEAEQKGGKQLVQVGFMRRYDADYRRMKALLEQDRVGAPLMVHCAHRNANPGSQYETKVNVTGVAIHEIDVVRWLLGEDFVSAKVVQPRVSKYVENGQKDPQIIMLQTKGGTVVDIETFMHCRYGYDIQCEVVGEEGTLRLPDPQAIPMRQAGKCSFAIMEDWRDRFVDAYNVEFQDWVDSVKQGVVRGPSAWDGYAAIVAADACTASRLSGTDAPIELEETPAFYKR